MVEKSKYNQKSNNDKYNCLCKKLIKHVCKQDYAWSIGTCASECHKHFDINEYFKVVLP